MELITNNSIPDASLFILDKASNTYSVLDAILLYRLMDLKYTLKDKLQIAHRLIGNEQVNIKGLLSNRDHQLLKVLLPSIQDQEDQEIRIFIELFEKTNLLENQNETLSNLTILINSEQLKKIDTSKKYDKFYKWISFSGAGKAKIQTLKAGKIYMANPIEFNDKFDCQLHLHDDFMLQIVNGDSRLLDKVRFFQTLATEFILATSFSLLNPLNTDSLHMWGLYGENGRGIALSYDLNDLILLMIKNIYGQQSKNILLFDTVNYETNYNPGNDFKILCEDYPIQGNGIKSLENFWSRFLTTKSKTWKNEQELRFFKYSLPTELFDELRKRISRYSDSEVLKELKKIQRNQKIDKQEDFGFPKEIFLGWNMVDSYRNKIISVSNSSMTGTKLVHLEKHLNYHNGEIYSNS